MSWTFLLSTGSAVFNGIGPTIVSETEEANLAAIEGYLFKRTTNAFKTWNRRWFMLKVSVACTIIPGNDDDDDEIDNGDDAGGNA